jgi:hypothetical protein
VIEFLGVTPEEVVRVEDDRDDEDNEIKAQINWVVTGDTTNVELTGGPPGFEKLSNLARVGEATIKVRDTTVFILTAYNGDAKVVKTAQIKFLDPTPTPDSGSSSGGGGSGGGGGGSGSSSTPTPVPPKIAFFTAAGITPPQDQVIFVGGNPPTYEVTADSNVSLNWGVQNATKVTLIGVGDQPPAGNLALYNVTVGQIYQLKAEGPGGNTQTFLQLTVVSPAPPPAPFNLAGLTVAGPPPQNVLNWQYDPNFIGRIAGFRVYRADVPGGAFSQVADETQLGKGTLSWTDTTTAADCKVYYVVAVYTGAGGALQETAATPNSWFSACP